MSKMIFIHLIALSFLPNMLVGMEEDGHKIKGDLVVVNVLPDLKLGHVSAKGCAHDLSARAGYVDEDTSGLVSTLKHYKGLAGNLATEPKNEKQKYAREVILRALLLGRQDLATSENSTTDGSVQQFIQQIMNERIAKLSEENGTNRKMKFGLSASTVTFGLTTAVFLVNWLLQKTMCSCDQASSC